MGEAQRNPISGDRDPGRAKRGEAVREACHPACFACRERSAGGLGLRFRTEGGQGVVGEFDCDPVYQSYPDRIHGGVVAMLLDAAMTHCLFHLGIAGVTGRLNVAFREPVAVGVRAEIRARLVVKDARLYRLHAEIRQQERVKAWAEGKFAPLPAGGI